MSLRSRYIFKSLELVLIGVCLGLLLVFNPVEVKKWLWVLYCVDSATFFEIIIVTIISYISESTWPSKTDTFDFYFTSAGIFLYFTAGVGGIHQKLSEPVDSGTGPAQLCLGIVLLVISILMAVDVAHSLYVVRQRREIVRRTGLTPERPQRQSRFEMK